MSARDFADGTDEAKRAAAWAALSDQEKSLASNGVYKKDFDAAIANLKVIDEQRRFADERGGPGVPRASRLRNSAHRRNSPTARPPPLQMPRERGVCQHQKRPVRC